MAKINLDRTIHAGGKVFFKGEAFVSEADKVLIDNELERLEQMEQEQEQSEEVKPPSKKKAANKND